MEQRDVFISYSVKDADWLFELKNVLKANRLSWWIAPDDIPGGSNYAKQIPDAIRNCKVFLLLLSDSAQRSLWVPREVDVAVNAHKPIVVCQIENCETFNEFDFYLTGYQRFLLFTQREQGYRKMVEQIQRFLQADLVCPIASGIGYDAVGRYVKALCQADPQILAWKTKNTGTEALRPVRQRWGVPEEEEILLSHTFSWFGKITGFAVCDSGIYYMMATDQECVRIPWKLILRCENLRGGLSCYLSGKVGTERMRIAYVAKFPVEETMDMLKYLIVAVQSAFGEYRI